MRTVIYYASFWLYLLCAAPCILWVLLLRSLGKGEQAGAFAARRAAAWGRTMMWLSGGEFSFEGLENIPTEGGVVLCSNHQGAFDIPLLLGYVPRPMGFVAKQELRKVPLLGSWMQQLGCLFLDRRDPRQALTVMREGATAIREGAALVVFAEGTRSGSATLGEFRQGSLRVAVTAEAPVVPVTIIDSYRLREAQGWRIRPAPVRVVVSPPIETAGMTRAEKKALLSRVREVIVANLEAGVSPDPGAE